MAELLIRPTRNDHVAIADLLIPAARASLASVRRPISRLVVDAPLAHEFPQYREAALEAGTSLIVDPRTDLLQVATDPKIGWGKLPYARHEPSVDLLTNSFMLAALVESVVTFQIEAGASAVVSPYFYAQSPEDPAFAATLECLRLTARELRQRGAGLPLIAVLCGSHRGFARQPTFAAGIDRFAAAALDVGPQMLALMLSPNGKGDEGQAKVLQLFTAAQRLKTTGATVMAWRQGFYGPGLVAAGLDGYETGTGVGERTDLATAYNSVKPGSRDGDGPKGTPAPVFFEALGRSLPRPMSRLLLDHPAARGLLACRDQRCCAHGYASMTETGNRRQHNVRTRARGLRDVEAMPHTPWRLHQIAKDAYATTVTTMKVNAILEDINSSTQLTTRGHESLAHVAELLSRTSEPRAA